MRVLTILLIVMLAGCATSKVYQPQAITYQQMVGWKVTNADCPQIDYIISNVENSLRIKGLLYADPSTLNNEDRIYNARARAIVWSLRIGCSNPDRYTK